MAFDRREFLKFMGVASATPLLTSCAQVQEMTNNYWGLLHKRAKGSFDFQALAPSKADELVLPQGFRYNVIRSWQDSITNGNFGFNNDFTSFFPIVKDGGSDYFPQSQKELTTNPAKFSQEGLLWVNHEYFDPRYIRKEKDQRKAVGGSIMRIAAQANGDWHFVDDFDLNRRLDAHTPFNVTGPVRSRYPIMTGTLANCSGGQTPWLTVLSGEENYHLYEEKYHWRNFDQQQYGWIIEVDPYNPEATPRKHSAMGRFAHENAATTISKSGKVVVYMGDDRAGEHIYKFVSRKKYNANDRKANFDILSEGELYVAKLEKDLASLPKGKKAKGKWYCISLEDPILQDHFSTEAEMLIETRKAAKLLGATPLDRAEDLEVSPYDKSIFVALTKNKDDANYFGSILRIFEKGSNHESLDFKYQVFAAGGEELGMACPDNLAFDNKGNLWVTTDISGGDLNKGRYEFHGNNSLFVIPLAGEQAGLPKRFASAPPGAELTGPWFSPDFKTLFLSVQHPGEDRLPSKWPNSLEHDYPRPSVVAITGFDQTLS